MGADDGDGKERLLPAREEGTAIGLEWGDGGKSFATETAGKPAFALKTAHQEKTYEMFRKHDALIASESSHIGLMHVLFFVLICVVSAVYANVYVSFGLFKNRVSVAEEEVYAELLSMRNVTVTIQRLDMLSHEAREIESKALHVPEMLVPAYHRRQMTTLFQINSRIIVGLEYIRSYDQTIRVATSCLYDSSPSKPTTNNCPLADVAAHLKAVNPQQEQALLNALMTIKLPLSEALDEKVLEKYPAAWTHVMQPSEFHLLLHNVHALNGLAALLLAAEKLTAYHHKLLKLQEKCLVDILTTAVNLMIYIETEVLVKNDEEKSLDLRSAVERSVELFRPKAAAQNIPISCTFSNGCPSMALIDEDQLMTTLTRTMAYVMDHSVEKGMGIDLYVNANASQHKNSKEKKDLNSQALQLYDVRFEVKGHGVCMENTKAQMMVQTKGLIDRAGQGLRLLMCSRIAQSLGGFMQIQSSPTRGTFISFILRRKARFSLEDLDSRFESLAGLEARVLTLSLQPETKQFFTFLCKDIGVTCLNCFCIKQLMDELKEDNPDCPVLAVFLGDFVKSSANPADRFSRSMAPREIFSKLLLHCAEGNKGIRFAFVSALNKGGGDDEQNQDNPGTPRNSPLPNTPNARASTLLDAVVYKQLMLPLKTSDVIDVIVTAMQERMRQREERSAPPDP
ncbi:hypothetical protein Emed_003648 [Eimeria media]